MPSRLSTSGTAIIFAGYGNKRGGSYEKKILVGSAFRAFAGIGQLSKDGTRRNECDIPYSGDFSLSGAEPNGAL